MMDCKQILKLAIRKSSGIYNLPQEVEFQLIGEKVLATATFGSVKYVAEQLGNVYAVRVTTPHFERIDRFRFLLGSLTQVQSTKV